MKKGSFLLLLLLGFSALLMASDKRGMTVADLFRVRTAGNPQLSADGNWVVYTLSNPDLNKNQIITHLYRVAFTGGDTLQLTRGESSEWHPQWQPRGQLLAFTSNRSGQNQIWLIHPFYGEPGQLTTTKTGVQEWQWSHDGTRIAFTTQDSLLKAEERKRNAGDDARVADADFQMTHLYVMNVVTRQIKRLTAGNFTVANPVWSVDDRQLYFVKRPTPAVDDAWKADILAVPADSGAVQAIAATEGTEVNPLSSPDGKWLAFTYSPGPGRWLGNARLYLVPTEGGEPRGVSAAFDGSVYAERWSPESRYIYFSTLTGISSNLLRLEVESGAVTNLSNNEDVLGSFDFSADCDHVVFTLQKPDRPQEVYSSVLAKFAPRRLTFSNPWLDGIEFGKTETVRWHSRDGKELEGLLVKPNGFATGKPVPTIVRIHGGPAGAYTRSFLANWDHYAHVLAANGYATFLPNFRGSVGYGEEFLRANIHDWGGGDFQDIMAGVDSLVAWQIADSQKLGVAGWSYGGYMTYWTITQTDRFQAAAAGAGLTNLFSMYSENDIPSVLDAYFGAAPWDDTTQYQRASPLTYVKNVKTPLLILQGEQDLRVPKFQSQQFYTALQQQGKKTKMLLFPRQGHGLVELKLQKQKVEEEIDWFNRYLHHQPTKPAGKVLTVDDLLALRAVGAPKISPDGKTVLFTISEQMPDSMATVSHIYRAELPDGDDSRLSVPVQITNDKKGEWHPQWSPQGERLAFLSTRTGKAQIFIMNPFYGEAGQISDAKSGVNDFRWSPDGKRLAYTTEDTLTEEEERQRQAGDDAQVWEVTEQKSHLWLVDAETNDTTRLTRGNFNVLEFAWSPDGKEIATTCAGYRVAEELSKSKLWLLDVQTKSARELPVGEIAMENLQWSPDGTRLAVVSHRGKDIGDIIRKPDILVFERAGWQKTNVTAGQVWDVSDYTWLPDGDLLVIGELGMNSQIYRLSLKDNSALPLSSGDFVRRYLSLSKDGSRISFLGATTEQLPEVFWSDLTAFAETRISNLSADLTEFELARTEEITWRSPDGTVVTGLLVKPPDFEAGLYYPLVVLPHGGPVGHYSREFHATAQLFAGNGFLVLLPNVRGSSAYGKQFLRANIGDLGGGDFEDLLSGVDYLVAASVADGERLGIWGWSYGGYMSAWAITQTDRFKAAVVGAAVTDWFSVYGQDDIQYDVEEYFLGTPYQNPILAAMRSPMTDVARVKTPTLILHGEKDFRDPLPQAQNFYLALKKQGIPVELVVYPREGHGIREYKHRRDMLQRSLDRLNQYLAPTPFVGEAR